MNGNGLSMLELRSIIEHGFLPLQCQCSVAPDTSLTVRVFDESSGRIDLLVTGISADQLNSSRAISQLVAELRHEIDLNRQASLSSYVAPGHAASSARSVA